MQRNLPTALIEKQRIVCATLAASGSWSAGKRERSVSHACFFRTLVIKEK
jgi:hypothetical protein